MSKTVKDAPLTTKAARERLPDGLHWRRIDATVHLGYRKRGGAGEWLVRWRVGAGYKQTRLAAADDELAADGGITLDFGRAEIEARRRVNEARAEAAAVKGGAPVTVMGACNVYADAIEARQRAAGRRVIRDARSRFSKHLGADDFGDVALTKLKAEDIAAWRERVRAKGLAPASLKRIATDIRAALNEAARLHGRHLPERFPLEVRGGFAPGTADRVPTATRPNVVLPDADVRRVIVAAREIDREGEWDGDLARAVVALAATGARFSQLVRCTVADLQTSPPRLLVPISYKGRGAKASTHVAVPLGDDVIAELRRAVVGRRGHEPLLMRAAFERFGRISWKKAGRRAWREDDIAAPFKLIAARAELSADVTAYALRHSSIVRGLRTGLPVRLVAAMHDTSSTMIEKHYSAYIVDAIGEAARAAIVPLTDAAPIVRVVSGASE